MSIKHTLLSLHLAYAIAEMPKISGGAIIANDMDDVPSIPMHRQPSFEIPTLRDTIFPNSACSPKEYGMNKRKKRKK